MNYHKYSNASQARRTRLAHKPVRLPNILAVLTRFGSSLKSIALEGLLGIMWWIVNAVRVAKGSLIIFAIAVAFIVYALQSFNFDLPTVHMSTATMECVKVIDSEGKEGLCANLPENYKLVWVK